MPVGMESARPLSPIHDYFRWHAVKHEFCDFEDGLRSQEMNGHFGKYYPSQRRNRWCIHTTTYPLTSVFSTSTTSPRSDGTPRKFGRKLTGVFVEQFAARSASLTIVRLILPCCPFVLLARAAFAQDAPPLHALAPCQFTDFAQSQADDNVIVGAVA
ncbi:MAG UNVERIFIED_CONTAM: hypothetical protein LVT10_07125 [Anaerolineae bacterium]|jgi:hypothetical protein